MNLQLVVTDMDGTFLDSRSQFDREAFRRLKGRCEKKYPLCLLYGEAV